MFYEFYGVEELVKVDAVVGVDVEDVENCLEFFEVDSVVEDLFHEGLPFVDLDVQTVIYINAYKTSKHRLSLLKPILYQQLRPLPLIPIKQNRNRYRSNNKQRNKHKRHKIQQIPVGLSHRRHHNIRVVISSKKHV